MLPGASAWNQQQEAVEYGPDLFGVFFLKSQYDILLSALEYLYSLVTDAASLCIYFWQMIADLE